MQDLVIERVLSSARLPTLPAVALRVIELSAKPDVSLREIADTIQNDQALAAKVLKTVKTVALGFSLIQAMGKDTDDGFDYESYWKRCLIAATGARAAAESANHPDAEEVFLAGLLMDAGAIAMHRALGDEYKSVEQAADGSHRALSAQEQETFGVNHAEIGARLAEQWRLPPSLVEPIRHHPDPTAVDAEYAMTTKCIALGALAAETLMRPAEGAAILVFRSKANEWLGLDEKQADTLFATIERNARAQASLFRVDMDGLPSAGELLAAAQEQLAEMALDAQMNADRLTAQNKSLQRQNEVDALTGVGNKRSLQVASARHFEVAQKEGKPLSILFLDLDFFKQINDTLGHIAGDVVLKEAARRLKATLGQRGELFRFGGEEFAAIMPGVDMKKAEAVAEMLRVALNSTPVDLTGAQTTKPQVRITTSVGVASYDNTSRDAIRSAEQLINAADQAVYAAKKSGRDCVRSFRFGGNSTSIAA